MIRKQDLTVLLFYYLGYPWVRNFLFRLQRKPVTRFVSFHDIPDEAEADFRAKLRFMKQHTNVVSLDDYFAGRLCWEKVNVVVTFDDGYKSWILKAAPALRELDIPATLFVSSGFLGLSKPQEEEFIRSRLRTNRKTIGGLTEEDVRQLAKQGFTIGGHTFNHANLSELHDRTELVREILSDKCKLESIIGQEVHYFAYPFGAYSNPDADLIGILKEAGYRGAVTTVSGFNTPSTDHHLLHRELTGPTTSLRVSKARILGASDAVNHLKKQASKFPRLRKKVFPASVSQI